MLTQRFIGYYVGMEKQFTPYQQQMADEICRRIMGGEKLVDICNEAGMPTINTVYVWRHHNQAFYDQYNKAREFQAEALFDEMLTIADKPHIGTRIVDGPKGKTIYTEDMIDHRRLQITTRQWMLPRMSKKMVDKSQLDHTSSDKSMSPMTDEERLAKVNTLINTVKKRVAAKKRIEAAPAGFVGDDGSDLA